MASFLKKSKTLIFIGAVINMFSKNIIIHFFLKRGFLFFAVIIIFIGGLFVFRVKLDADRDLSAIYENVQNRSNDINCYPLVRSSEDFHGERTNFSFSPDKIYVAFIQDVFDEYGKDWDRYWALKLFDSKANKEKILFVGDYKVSRYSWLDGDTIRILRGAGTGVRVYLDVSIHEKQTIFSKDFKKGEGWLLDEKYSEEIKNIEEAQRLYERDK